MRRPPPSRIAMATENPREPLLPGISYVRNRLFPEIGLTLPVAGDDLVHRRRLVEPTVEHDVLDLVGMADILQRIVPQDDEVGQLARLDRAEIVVEAEMTAGIAVAAISASSGVKPPRTKDHISQCAARPCCWP